MSERRARLDDGSRGSRVDAGRGGLVGGSRRGRRRVVVALQVFVLCVAAGAAVVPTGVAATSAPTLDAAVPQTGIAVAPNTLIALQQARGTGQSVIVKDQMSKTSTVYANPDGSFSATIADGPVQEPDASAPTGFTPIDLALRQAMNGSWQPKVADAQLAFSNGGAGSAASLTAGGHVLSMTLGSSLPTPVISGTTATYKDVQPGVDLVVQALTSGFDLRIVLTKQPSTVTAFRLPLALTGLSASVAANGRLSFLNAGKAIAQADAPVMYDASLDASGQPANVVTVPTSVSSTGGTALVVSPTASFLTDPGTKYPVTIDPSPNLVATIDTYVDSSNPTTTYGGAVLLKAGKQSSSSGPMRSFLQFDATSFGGANVSAASLNLYESYAGSCTASALQVWDISATWNQSVNWNTQPAKSAMWASGNTSAGGGTGCPAGYVSLSSGGTGSNTLQSLVQSWARETLPNNGLEVVAGSETATASAKRFSSNEAGSNAPYLAVTYNYPPGVSGGRLPNNAAFIPTTRPTLQGTFFDLDAGTVGQIQYELDTNAGAVIDTQLGSTVMSGSTSSWQVPTTDNLANGTTYKWRARGYDGIDYGLWTGYRTFTIDTTAPGTPVITSSTHPDPAQWYTATGFTGSWPAVTDSTSGVAGYAVKVDKNLGTVPSGVIQTALTYSKTVSYSGIWYLHVRAEDNAGNWGQTTTYQFNVGTGGFLSPSKGDRTQQYYTLQAAAQTALTGATFQYRRGRLDAWTTIPVGDVVDSDNGNAAITWPVSFFGTAHSTHHLRWDAKSTLGSVDGPILVRATFVGTPTPADPIQVSLDQSFFGQSASQGSAFAQVGPGQVNLLTGDYTLGASDANVGGFGVDRMFDSTTPNAQSAGIFGPGWSSSLNLGTYQKLHSGADSSQGSFVTIYGADDTEYDFYADDVSATYNTLPNDAGMALVKCTGLDTPSTGCKVSATFLLTDQSGVQTTFSLPSGASGATDYVPSAIVTPNSGSAAAATTTISSVAVGGVTRPTQEIAQSPSGVTCSTTSTLTTQGCQTLTFAYATSNTSSSTCSTSFGDFSGQLKTISYTAYDPAPGQHQMRTIDVASYSYDTNGRLRATCDPRISPVLATTYAYDAVGRVSTITPPGVNAWTLSYDSTNRLTSASRANDPTGTQTTSVVYGVPLSGSGAPYNLSTAAAAAWGQQDVPAGTATAIFPPREVPSGNPPADYNYATVFYMDANGNAVNVAQPGGYIATSEYDQNGNRVRTLTAQNRADALLSTDSASYSLTHDTQYTYDASGVELLRQLGPDHQIMLSNGTITMARRDVQYAYDQGAPSGGPFNLVTSQSVGALADNATSDVDVRTTTSDYSGQSNIGWSLFQPTSTTVDSGVGHLNVTTTVRYDNLGRVTATVAPANPAGGDAHETDRVYYRSGTGSGVSACDNHPEWDGLTCQTGPAAQPNIIGYPDLPVTTYTYDIWGDIATTTDTVGASVRTTTNSYEAASTAACPGSTCTTGRLANQAISGPGTGLPNKDYGYSSTSGLPTTTSTTNGGTSTIITHAYDLDGRLKSYTDGDGNQSTYSYDTSSRITSVSDGKGTDTLSYDQGAERRGFLTGASDSQAGAFAGSYNADGTLTSQTYPNGMTATVTIDAEGTPTALNYVKTTNCSSGCTWYADQVVPSIQDQWLSQSSSISGQNYTYDAAGRLTWVYDTLAGQCSTRQYAYDLDSNRTALTSRVPNSDGSCNTTATGTSQSWTYDSADRVSTAGYSFDAMGRITSVPASDNGGNGATVSYFVNDMVNTVSESGTTETVSLDPASRIRQVTAADTKLYHYASDGDVPGWIAENGSGTQWTRNIQGLSGLVAVSDNTGATMLQIENLHGDIVGEAPTAATATSLSSVFEQTEFGQPRQGSRRYGWLGSDQRAQDTLSGWTFMGARLYNPRVGRFLQSDPMPGGSANSYDYANQDPIGNFDPTGAGVIDDFHWNHNRTVYYGWGADAVVGTNQEGMSIQIVGRKVLHVSMSLQVLTGPSLHMHFHWNCTGSGGCGYYGVSSLHYTNWMSTGIAPAYRGPGYRQYTVHFTISYEALGEGPFTWTNPLDQSPTITCPSGKWCHF
jgi:RHS repeat-associated protein